jgi:small subunit ribosomal protein S16
MAVHIRLSRGGAKKTPFYRIVVTDQRNRRDGRFLEKLGTFDPSRDESFRLDKERYDYWRSVGAQPTEAVTSVLRRLYKEPKAAQ